MSAVHLMIVELAGLALMSLACAWAFLMRGGPAAARQRSWRLGFVALLGMSGLSFAPWLPKLPAPSRAAASVVEVKATALDAIASRAPAHAPEPRAAAHSGIPAGGPVRGGFKWSDFLVASWLGGLTLLLASWLLGLTRVARWASRAVMIDREADPLGQRLGKDVPDSVEVRLHPDCLLPVTVGLFRPAILLPLEARDWDPSRLRIVLLHELAHVKGRDPLHRAIAELGTALHWPNPLTWLARRRLCLEQEHAADDGVLVSGVRPASYATELIALAETASLRFAGVVPMAEKAGLVDRIEHIVAAGKLRSESPRAAQAARLFFCLAAVGLASLPFRPADAVPRNLPPSRGESIQPRVVSCDALGSWKSSSSDQEMAVHWWNDSGAPISIASVDADGRPQTKDAPIVAPGSGHTVWRKVGQLGVALGPSGNCLSAVSYQLGQNDILLREGGRISGNDASDRIAALVAAQDQYTERASCAELSTLKSPGGGLWRAVRFWNDTGLPIAIDSIDESGKRDLVMSLAAGAVKDYWGTEDWHLFVASTSDGLCLGVAAGPKDGQDVVFTASGALHGPEREARIDALAVAKAVASETQLAACRAAVSAGSADQVKLNDCRRVLRGLAGAYDPKLPPEGTALAGDFTDDFQRAEIGPNYFASSARWRILDGELTASDGKNQPLWLKAALPADVRIEFDARSDSAEGDIKCELFGDGYSHASGYILILAGWENSLTTLARLGEHAPAVTSFANGLPANGQVRVERRDLRVEPGRAYHWLIQRRGGTILWQVDGKTVFEETDPQPLEGPGHDRFGFSGWETSVHFDNLEVAQLR